MGNERTKTKKSKKMDSIELLKKLGGKFGKECKIGVTTGDTYSGLYYGAEAFDTEAPLW